MFFTLFTGINQLQWALEFLRCMKVDYGYPESIEKIVGELEEQLISLYAKVGEKMQENKRKKDLEEMEKDEKTSKSEYLYTFVLVNLRGIAIAIRVSDKRYFIASLFFSQNAITFYNIRQTFWAESNIRAL